MNKGYIKKKLLYGILLLLTPALAAGCSGAAPETPDVSVKVIEPGPEISVQIFGEVSDSGDIKINGSVLAEIKTRTYEYPEPPTVLIYHTHATEAFLQDENYTYEESGEWRTEDNEKNIVHLGEVLKSELESLGFNVIHDKTNVEPPELKSAYSRSLEVMKKYGDADIYIDLHRNAADPETVKNNSVTIDGKACAKLFFVVGTGIGTYEGEYDVAPDWKANYALALSVQEKVSDAAEGIMKSIRTKVGRYNQHMGMCLLAEVGNNANTMEEVLNTLPYFAEALSEVVKFQG
jgi:stage II sporulation protein P